MYPGWVRPSRTHPAPPPHPGAAAVGRKKAAAATTVKDTGAFPGILRAYCASKGFPAPQPEHRFHPARDWAFDFAWPGLMLALEVEGGTRLPGGGRHNRAGGYEEDALKYSHAAILGWCVVRVTWRQVNAGTVYDLIDLAVRARTAPSTPPPPGA
jgi:hypothetical protein